MSRPENASPPAPEGWARVWPWVWKPLRFAFRAVAVGYALLLLVGWVLLLRLPILAQAHGTDVFFLALRCLDYQTDRPVWPLFLLDPEHRVAAVALEVRSPVRVAAPSGPTGGRDTVASLYDLDDPAIHAGIRVWGDGLLRIGIAQAEDQKLLHKGSGSRADASLDEACRAIAPLLRGIQPHAGHDLPQLGRLAEVAFASPAERDAAFRWAETLYDRLAQFHADRGSKKVGNLAHENIAVALPPRTPATMWWLVYQFVGLDGPSRAAAARQWASLFSAARGEQIRAIGKRIESARRAAGEPLPPSSESVAWVCVIERYQGLDARGSRDRALVAAGIPPNSLDTVAFALRVAAPADDFFYPLVNGDPLHLIAEPEAGNLLGIVWLTLLGMYGFRVLLFPILAEFVLRLGTVRVYLAYRAGRGHGSLWPWLVGFGVVPLVGWGLALIYLPDHLVPLAGSPQAMLFAAYMAVLLGGTFLGFLTRLTALILIARGVDVNRVWYDEFIGMAVALPLLWFLGNDAVALALIVAAEVLPMLLQPRPAPVES